MGRGRLCGGEGVIGRAARVWTRSSGRLCNQKIVNEVQDKTEGIT